MSIITTILTLALLHCSRAQVTQTVSGVKLGCLRAAPDSSESFLLDSSDISRSACITSCAASASSYAYYNASSSACRCGPSPAENTLYVDALDHDANCGDSSIWYTAIPNNSTSIETNTTCPSLGPTSSADLPGYIYLSSFPDPLACYSACEAAGLGVTLLQPGLGGYSCACAKSMSGERYREVCNSQSWYAVQKA